MFLHYHLWNSREGKVAIYGNNALINVTMVEAIPYMGKDSRKENGKWERGDRRKGKTNLFAVLLADETNKNRDADIRITTVGYNKAARMVTNNYHTHEY